MAIKESNDDGEEPSSLSDRRNFFHSATTKAASISLLVAATTTATTSHDVAQAAVDEDVSSSMSSTSYSNIYQPASHSMDGKIIVITGGNAGLGLESTKRLAKAGATVIFTSRDETKGRTALDEINNYLSNEKANDTTFAGKVMVAQLDLCDLDNVKSFNNRLISLVGKDTNIDVLLNNAGVMAIPDLRTTKDGYEKTFSFNK